MTSNQKPAAKAQMLIRKPAADVFEAFVNPEITSKFWFTKSTGRLEAGKTVTWTWGQFGVSGEITVTELKQDRLIAFEWPSGDEESAFRTVKISLESQSDDATFVQAVETGFDEDSDLLIETIAGQTEGWTLVLAAMKAWLEHELNLNLISDHHPQ